MEEFKEPEKNIKNEVNLESSLLNKKKEFSDLMIELRFDTALILKEEFNLPDEILFLPEVQEAAEKIFSEKISWGMKSVFNDGIGLIKTFSFSEETVQKLALKVFVEEVTSKYGVRQSSKIKEVFNLSDELISSHEAQNMAFDVFKKRIQSTIGSLEDLVKQALTVKEKFNLPDEMIQKVVIKFFTKRLSSGTSLYSILKIKEKFNLPDEILFLTEVQEAASELLVKTLSGDYYDAYEEAFKVIETFNLSEEHLESSRVQKAAQKAVLNSVKKSRWHSLDFIEKFRLSDELISLDEIQVAARKYLVDNLIRSNNDEYLEIALKIKDVFQISAESLSSPEVQDAVQNLFVAKVSSRNIKNAFEIKDQFNLSDNFLSSLEVKEAIKNPIQHIIFHKGPDEMLEFRKKFTVDGDFIEKNIMDVFTQEISSGNFKKAFEVKKKFSLSDEVLFLPNVLDGVKKALIGKLSGHQLEEAVTMIKKFKISIEDLYPLLSNDQKGRLEMIENLVPGFTQKAISSGDMFVSVLSLSFENVQLLINNPTLLHRFTENPSMAFKLLLKYPEFNESSKENINFLLEAKQKILEHNPDIDSNSHEFRLMMQEQLKQYKRNFDMINQMGEEGVNTDQWLNYSEETLFELGGEEASYAELIKLPSERISQTLKKHGEVIEHALSMHKKVLLTKEVSLIDALEIEEKITQMQKLADEAEQSGNTNKAQGIQKGIDGLRKQIEKGKKIPAWLKIMSDVDMIKKLFERASMINTEISVFDEENQTLAKENSKINQKKMFENKQKIKDKSIEFVSHLKTTEIRMESLYTSIENNLSQTLGKEQSKSILDELSDRLAEEREHFTSDKSTLESVIKLNESEDDVKGSLLKIKVWDRNPDIDLYMGNYSDCCVRIDSEYHGSESPISDYITDLGIQIVAAYDEKTGKPFAAAWCFIGEDRNGNKAFVVDNIEAMGPCMRYKDDIQNRMKKYIEQYAKQSGLEVISQGPHHNDLVVTQNLEEKYTKLAGYNNTRGYYLEAEPEDYEDEENEEGENHPEEQRLIDQYSRTQENIVSLEEALNRATQN